MNFILMLNLTPNCISFVILFFLNLVLYIFSLMLKVHIQEEKHVELLRAGKQAKHRLEELAPEIQLKGKGD